MEIQLFDQHHGEARRLVRTGAPVYLTINPVEYHGPHLSLHNDRLISLGLARDLHVRLSEGRDVPLLLASDLEVGVEPCPGPGTRHTHFPAQRALVVEACRALAELGAQRVVLMTFHGAPLHNLALDAGVRWLQANGVRALSPFNLVLREMLMLDDPARFAPALAHIGDPVERAAMLAGLKFDFHAGFFETSVALHYASDSVAPQHRELPPCPEVTPDARFAAAARVARSLGRDLLSRELTFAAVGLGWNALRPFYGYSGRPHLAAASAGAWFARHIVEVYAPVARAVLEEGAAPPDPIMPWAGRMSLGGRIGAIPRPGMSDLAFA